MSRVFILCDFKKTYACIRALRFSSDDLSYLWDGFVSHYEMQIQLAVLLLPV